MRNLQVKVVERQQNISIQEQEIMRKEKELDSKVGLQRSKYFLLNIFIFRSKNLQRPRSSS